MEKKNKSMLAYIFYACSGECKNFKDCKIQTQGLRPWPQKTNMIKDLGIKINPPPPRKHIRLLKDFKGKKEALNMSGLPKACCLFSQLC